MIDYAEAHISTEQSSPGKDTRVSGPYGDKERPPSTEKAAREGAEEAHTSALLKKRYLPRESRLRSPREFRNVYQHGKRYDGRLMTAFVLPNGSTRHRLGVTASRKVSRKAVERNRLKRLLREAFRLSNEGLDGLLARYDWVLNAKRSLLDVKVDASLRDLQKLIAQVENKELKS